MKDILSKAMSHRFVAGSITYGKKHKIITAIIVIVALSGAYYAYGKATSTTGQLRYVLGNATTGTIIASVSESGQVSSTNSVDIKPQVSGTITWLGVKAGDKVRAGQALATIDDSDAVQALADAKKNLAADKLTFQKSSAQAPIDYQNDLNALDTAKEDLSDDYNDSFNDLTSVYLDLPAVISSAENILYGYDFDKKKSQWNMDVLYNLFTKIQDTSSAKAFQTSSVDAYTTANTKYEAALSKYQMTTRTSDTADIDSLLSQSIDMVTDTAQALQNELNFLGAVSDLATTYNIALPSDFSTIQTSARTNLSTANNDLSTLLADKKTLSNDAKAITSAEQTITLDQVGNANGDNPISLQVSANSIAKEEQDIANQEADLADYTIVAPFAGTISAVDVAKGDSAGSSAIASIISTAEIVQLSINEVDAAKIKLGDKATLTFDAIDGLTLTGSVAEIDNVGTVSQGVVSYTIKISFDTQDARVKPGMTVNASIVTDVRQNVIMVPSSAVKTVNGSSYVMAFMPPIGTASSTTAVDQSGILSSTPPQNIPVTLGISDDSNVEILSGISDGQQIVVRTIMSGKTATAATSATSRGAAGGPRNAGFGGGAAAAIRL
jgi:HlyD family secretion protein